MNGRLAACVLLLLLSVMNEAAAQAVAPENPVPGKQEPPLEYVSLAQAMLERLRSERPALVEEALKLESRLPEAMKELGERARARGGRGIEAAPESSLDVLASAVERWTAGKTEAPPMQIRFTAGRFTTARGALAPVAALVEKRERKQRLMAEVIVLIQEIIVERSRREREEQEFRKDEEKSSRLQADGSAVAPSEATSPFYAIGN